MLKNFDLSALLASIRNADWREPRVFMRAILVILLVMNLAAAAVALHFFGRSASEVAQEVDAGRNELKQTRQRLEQTRTIVGKVQTARTEGDQFLASYMTPRRTTYSLVVSELQQTAEQAGMSMRESTFSPLDPVKGSDDLSKMTITASFDGTYANLLKFVNLLDHSPRFLIIESLQAAPQPSKNTLTVTIKIDTFVRDDSGDAA